jgi:hypothetical protein
MVMLVLELWNQTAVNGKKDAGKEQLDNSLIAIVVVVMVAWEFIQFAISEKAGGERLIRRDASDKEKVLESWSFQDTQKVDCSVMEITNEER